MRDTTKSTKSRILAAVAGVSMFGLAVSGCGTIVGGAVGAGSGAAISAGTGHSPAKGALIGAGVGAAAGTIYEIVR
jgi:hypothetical protein